MLYNADDVSSKMTKGTTAGGNVFTQAGNIITLLMAKGGGMKLSASVTRHTHDYTVFVKHIKVPTCSETGLDEYKCAYCTATTQKTVDKNPNNHTGGTEIRNAVEASCSQEGYTGDMYCKGCGVKLASGEKIEKKAHTEVTDAAVAATCTESGLTAGKHCSGCNAVLVAQTVVPATGHTPGEAVPENEISPKNGVAGSYDEVVYCKVCNEELSRETIIVPPPTDNTKGNPNSGEGDVANANNGVFNPDPLEGSFFRRMIWDDTFESTADPAFRFVRADHSAATNARFRASMPAGWQRVFTFCIYESGRPCIPVDGKLYLKIPSEYQNEGRKFALLGMDPYANVIVFNDTDNDSATITAEISIEGYQFMLIYKD